MCTRRHLLGALSLGFLLVGSFGTASAAEPITLKVSVVHATRTGSEVDPALANIRGSLEQAFGGYTSFKQLDRAELAIARGGSGEVALPNGKTAVFEYKGLAGTQHQLKLRIPQSKVEVDLRAPAKRMFYQAGMPHDGGILILALYLKD
jgi:hypothetical protein